MYTDNLRRAVSKKNKDAFDIYKPKFINGCIKNNVDDIVGELEFVNCENPYIMFYTKSKLSDTVMKYLEDASCIFFYGGDFNKHKNAYFYLIKIHKKGLYLYENDSSKQ